MFTILMKDVDGRRSYRYFKNWKKAERAMMQDVEDCMSGQHVIGAWSIDRMNVAKSFYEREETWLLDGGVRFHWALIDGYFEDDLVK